MKPFWLLVTGILGGLLAAGILLLVTRPPRGAPVVLQPAPTAAPLVVHITGAVQQPGVVTLAPGSRVQEAIAAGGGLTAQADIRGLNLAQPLVDGMQVYVPSQSESAPPALALPVSPATTAEILRLNLNTATQADLERLPGIGPVMAERILQYRQEHGSFEHIEQIMDVDGIGEGTFAEIQDLISAEQP
ncbi:MAG: helix-hairpin-helix domain-containing protein [Anaerolineales bacterium]